MKKSLIILLLLGSFFCVAQKNNCQIISIEDKEKFRATIIKTFESEEYIESIRQFQDVKNGILLLRFTEGNGISCFYIDIDKMEGRRLDNLTNKKLNQEEKDSFYEQTQKIDTTNYLEDCPQYGHSSMYWMMVKKDNTLLGEYCVSNNLTKAKPSTDAGYAALKTTFDWVVRLYYK
ncbi:MAG: hypothetical protein QM710_06710 [Flavobacterium sp.]